MSWSRKGTWRAITVGMVAIVVAGPAWAQSPGRVVDLAPRLKACTACHQADTALREDGFVPSLAGKPAAYLLAQLRHFREGRRHNPVMRELLQGLPEDYLAEIAGYFSAQPLLRTGHTPGAAPPGTGAPTRGEQLARGGQGPAGAPACVACHGPALTGVLPAVPGLLGLPRNYLVGQLGAWRNGQRQAAQPDCMARVARALSADDLVQVATWLAAQPLPAMAQPAAPASRPLPWTCGSLPGVAP
jgi:cytochrome c553